MSAGERLTLEAFVARARPKLDAGLGQHLARLQEIADHLLQHLGAEPELAAQVTAFRDALPEQLASAERAERLAAVTEAERLVADIKARWIAAENPPLVDEIDERLAEIGAELEHLRHPGTEALDEAASQIDRLGRVGAGMEGIERRYLPWAAAGAIMFVIGLVLFLWPGLMRLVPALASFWTIMVCLIVLPCVAVHYALTVMPRSRADAEIDTLNRAHFVPLGGLYFPEGEKAACVITIDPPKPKSEGEIAREERETNARRAGRLR